MQTILTFLWPSTLFLAVGGLVVWLLMRLCRCRGSQLTQIAWCLVLLQGIVVFRLPVDLPLLEPEPRPVVTMESTVSRERLIQPSVVPVTYSEPSEPQQSWSVVEPSITPAFRWKTSHTITVLFVGWISGVLLLIFWQMYSWLQTLNLLQSQAALSDEHQLEWLTLLEEENVDPAKLRLIMAEFAGPGLFKLPRGYAVVIPTSLWQEATPVVRRGILRHELSHYRHHDLAKSFALRLIVLLHWFNPVAWLAARRFEEAVEWRCDIDAFGHDPQGGADFAEALLVFRDTTPVAAVYRNAFCGTNIITRVKRLIEHTQHKGDSLMKKGFILTATILLLGCGLFQFNLTAKTSPQENGAPLETEFIGEKDTEYVKVRGKALLPDGTPAKKFEIHYGSYPRNQRNTQLGGITYVLGGITYVQEDGTFLLNALVESDGMIAIQDPENRWATPYQLFTVNDKDLEEEIVFQFEPGIKVSGTIRDKETGKPIPNLEMTLRIHPEDSDEFHSVSFDRNTDKNGRYEWIVFPKGKTYLTVGREYRIPALYDGDSIDRDFEELNRREDLPEETRQYVRQYLESLKNLPELLKNYVRKVEFGEQKEITFDFNIPSPFVGKVLKADGFPATGINVHIIGNDMRDLGASMSSFSETDKDGIFRCTKTPKNVSVRITDYRNKEYYLNWFDDELGKDGEHVFRLKPSCVVKGRLIDAATGEPMPEQLFLYHGNPDRMEFTPNSIKTDKDGCFTLDHDIADNVKYDLFLAPGRTEYHGGSFPVRVELGEILIETPGETLDLGDIRVDLTQAKHVEE